MNRRHLLFCAVLALAAVLGVVALTPEPPPPPDDQQVDTGYSRQRTEAEMCALGYVQC